MERFLGRQIKLLAIAFGFFLLGVHAHGADYMSVSPAMIRKNVDEAGTVVEVRGRLHGTGIIVHYNGHPAILTNSHVLEGETSAEISFGVEDLPRNANPAAFSSTALSSRIYFDARAGQSGMAQLREAELPQGARAQVLFDSPLDDVAILTIPDGLNQATEDFFLIASLVNAQFCQPGRPYCPDKGFVVGAPNAPDTDRANAVINSRVFSTRVIMPWQGTLVTDHYVSGEYSQVYFLPMFLKPGVSGGAYYRNGSFAGMITKVSVSGEPISIAIPVEEIALALRRAPRGRWVENDGHFHLEIPVGETVLSSGPRAEGYQSAGGEAGNGGGEAGNGGGEAGNGGGDLHESSIWTLGIRDTSLMQTSNGQQSNRLVQFEMQNPFAKQSQELKINGRQVLYFEAQGAPMASSSAAYIYEQKTDPTHFRVRYADESDAIHDLETLRARNAQPLKYARAYVRSRDGAYEMANFDCDTAAGDGAQALLPEFVRFPKDAKAQTFCKEMKAAQKDQARYLVHSIFFAHKTLGSVLEAGWHTGFLKSNRVSIPNNMSRISISGDDTVELAPTGANHVTSITFKAVRGTPDTRAIAIYDVDHLDRLERVFIEKKPFLFEFVGCTPGEDCVR